MVERESGGGPRGYLRRVRDNRLGLQLFDHHWYRDASGRYGRKIGLYRHFLTDGWRHGLDPNGWFSCAGYLRMNPDVAQSGLNPWVHFIRSGRQEQRPLVSNARGPVGPLTLEDTLLDAARGLVDDHFYRAAYDDVAATGLTAAEHFAAYGWKEGRTPAPWFNTKYLRTHAPSYRLGTGNPLADLLRITTGVSQPEPAPTNWWVDPDAALPALRGMRAKADVLVVIHAYYPEDLDVFSKHIKCLGPSVQIVMTCMANTATVCERWAESNSFDATVVETVNRGRDWGPFLAVAGEIGQSGWDTVLKLHTKRSPHREDGAEWLKRVLDGLVPNEDVAGRVNALFTDQRHDVLAAPGTLSSARGWKPEGRVAREVYSRYVNEREEIRFPAGSMFWLSGRLLVRLGGLEITVSDFEPELGQLEGTLGHALERLVVKLYPSEPGLVPDQSSD